MPINLKDGFVRSRRAASEVPRSWYYNSCRHPVWGVCTGGCAFRNVCLFAYLGLAMSLILIGLFAVDGGCHLVFLDVL